MIRNILLAGASVIGLTAAAWAADTPVQEIDVEVDLTAIQNPEAAQVFTNLSDDLKNAIAARLAPDRLVDTGGSKIDINIDEVELSSTWANLSDLSQSKLKGLVNISSDTDGLKFDNYTLTVAYPEATAFIPEGANPDTLTQDAGIYYTALINAFADQVVANLK